jgi:hypothetical protein
VVVHGQQANVWRSLRFRKFSPPGFQRTGMTDPEDAIEQFLAAADDCYADYDKGYDDADATLRRLEAHIDELRSATE